MVAAGTSAESNIYENVPYGQMVEKFNDWIFDENRKPGDTDIVETVYGYHVMYFVSFADQPFGNNGLQNNSPTNDLPKRWKLLKKR